MRPSAFVIALGRSSFTHQGGESRSSLTHQGSGETRCCLTRICGVRGALPSRGVRFGHRGCTGESAEGMVTTASWGGASPVAEPGR